MKASAADTQLDAVSTSLRMWDFLPKMDGI